MRSPAQIDQSTAAIDGTLVPSHKLVDIVQLVLAVRKHLLEVLLGDLQPVETLLLLVYARGSGLKCRPVGGEDDTSVDHSELVPRHDFRTAYPAFTYSPGMAAS